METTTYQVIDPRGDILLLFPGQPQQQRQQDGPHNPVSQPRLDGGQMSPVLSSPQTVCSALTKHSVSPFMAPAGPATSSSDPRNSSDTVSLRVSSSVLCLASPVLAAMLSGSMAEAKAFNAVDSPRPFPLLLYEDDGHVFAILANIIHFRSQAVPLLPSTATLLSLAFLVDKYDCAPALRPQGEIWLNRAIEARNSSEYGSIDRLCDLLLVAYALDLPTHFFQLSWEVILNHRQQLKGETEFGLDLPIPPDHGLLRTGNDIHAEIAKRKARLRRDMHNALMAPITEVTRLLDNYSGEPADMKLTCPNAAIAMGNYLAFLDINNLCPWRAQYETDSFSSIIKRATEAAALASDKPVLRFEACSRTRCNCSAMAYNDQVQMAQKLSWEISRAWKWKLGACLDCLRNQNGDSNPCRVEHW
ncbi:hypothetical protein QBC34DRAFT_414157 [Podospora aff. communis PSN243]|uniref:BTB domain-containing protein n=1 Tax=Podospora aff. communis PSN243 TaxID=3040156 RepID=A0AAV9G8Y8_9PEZI|nr:hypothetical protein QBC34DRAFT_414157 [Podospora aff. communis PSN243]